MKLLNWSECAKLLWLYGVHACLSKVSKVVTGKS